MVGGAPKRTGPEENRIKDKVVFNVVTTEKNQVQESPQGKGSWSVLQMFGSELWAVWTQGPYGWSADSPSDRGWAKGDDPAHQEGWKDLDSDVSEYSGFQEAG